MSITREQVIKISQLARLQVNEEDLEKYSQELSSIFDLVEQMNQVNTDTAPTTHPLDLNQRLREDIVSEQDQRAQLQAGAPSVAAGLYLVPQVIE